MVLFSKTLLSARDTEIFMVEIYLQCAITGASQVALVVKDPPANAGEARELVRSLGREDPLEEDMATESHGQWNLAGYSQQGCSRT